MSAALLAWRRTLGLHSGHGLATMGVSFSWRRMIGLSSGYRFPTAAAATFSNISLLSKNLNLMDKMASIKKLEAQGFPREHAEAITVILREDLNNFTVREVLRNRPSTGQKMKLEALVIPANLADWIDTFFRQCINNPHLLKRRNPIQFEVAWEVFWRLKKLGIPCSDAGAIGEVLRDGLEKAAQFLSVASDMEKVGDKSLSDDDGMDQEREKVGDKLDGHDNGKANVVRILNFLTVEPEMENLGDKPRNDHEPSATSSLWSLIEFFLDHTVMSLVITAFVIDVLLILVVRSN